MTERTMQDAIETADAYVNNYGLPTYTELAALVQSLAWLRPGDQIGSGDVERIARLAAQIKTEQERAARFR